MSHAKMYCTTINHNNQTTNQNGQQRRRRRRDDKTKTFEEIVIGSDATLLSLRAMTGRTTVPQVFIAGEHIGGADELTAHLA